MSVSFSLETSTYQEPEWKRNPSWLAIPSVTAAEQKFVGLYAVFPNGGNFVAISANSTSGTYDVNWGDGSGNNSITTATTAMYEYDFNDTDLVGTDAPVTLVVSTSRVNRTAHGYSNGDTINLYRITSTTGLSNAQSYYVCNANTNSFQVSLNPRKYENYAGTANGSSTITGIGNTTELRAGQKVSGSTIPAGTTIQSVANTTAIVLSNSVSAGNINFDVFIDYNPVTFGGADGTAALLEYRQAIVTVTSSGVIQGFSLNVKHTNQIASVAVNWLDIEVSMPNALAFSLSGTTLQTTLALLEHCNIAAFGSITSLSYAFYNCYVLQSVTIPDTSAITDMSYMFGNCRRLTIAPYMNTSAVTTFAGMFFSCLKLKSLPLYNTSNATEFQAMFQSCYALESIPAFNTIKATAMNSMFSGCSSLVTVPSFNTTVLYNVGYMFSGCSSLVSAPTFNTAGIVNTTGMFQSCVSLKHVPLYNTASVTNMSYMFQLCSALESVPLFDTKSATTLAYMFSGCSNLRHVPKFNTQSCNTITNMFYACYNLEVIPEINTSGVVDISSAFSYCYKCRYIPAFNFQSVSAASYYVNAFFDCRSVTKVLATNFKWSFSVSDLSLSSSELNNIYTNLPVVTGQTITVTNNFGTASDDPTIATAKGWTVTG